MIEPAGAISTPLQIPVETGAAILKKTGSKVPPTTPKKSTMKKISKQPKQHIANDLTNIALNKAEKVLTVKQKSTGETSRINKTQSETEIENLSLVTLMFVDKTQASISERLSDSADTGENVDDLPEDRERNSE